MPASQIKCIDRYIECKTLIPIHTNVHALSRKVVEISSQKKGGTRYSKGGEGMGGDVYMRKEIAGSLCACFRVAFKKPTDSNRSSV
jgi:hypothetical protein